jgi:hypothetical protein
LLLNHCFLERAMSSAFLPDHVNDRTVLAS